MKARLLRRIAASLFPVLGLFLLLCVPGRLAAQLDRGEITGTAEDPSHAVVQNASIVLTNDSTGVKTTTKSTSTGTYVFDDVIPGKYAIEAEAGGFEKYVVHDLYVQVQQVLTVDIHFATGNVQQSVTVTASAPLLEAENAQVGQSITNEAVNDLPLATRDWGSLAQMSAGVSTTCDRIRWRRHYRRRRQLRVCLFQGEWRRRMAKRFPPERH
jgi:hypothetical protein